MEAADIDLLEAWREGDKQAGTVLFRRYFRQVRRFFYNKVPEREVEDLLQKTFTAVVEGRDRFRGDASFRTFMFSVAWRVFYRYLRDHARRYSKHEEDLNVSSIAELGVTPGTVVAIKQEAEWVRVALQRIPVNFQAILELHYWEGLAAAEIAVILDIEPTTARTRLHRGRKALEKALAELMPADAQMPDIERTVRSVGEMI